MNFVKLKDYEVNSGELVKVTSMGNVTELLYMRRKNNVCPIKMIDKDHYIILSEDSGELYECNHITDRSQSANNIKRTMRVLRNTINANVIDESNCRWLTLTYAENMTDHKRIKADFMHFNKRLRDVVGNYEYIAVREPQARGAWHLHVIMVFDKRAPYIASQLVSDCWKKGFVQIKKLDSVDNVGAYLTAYLCDLDFDDALKNGLLKPGDVVNVKEVDYKQVEAADGQAFDAAKPSEAHEALCEVSETRSGEVIKAVSDSCSTGKKLYIKGGRLCLYPPNMNLYSCSKGIRKPKAEYMTEENAQKKISSAKLTFSTAVQLIDDGFENTIYKRYYNSKRI